KTVKWDREPRGATGSIDEARRARDRRPGRADRIDRLLDRATGGHDVVDDQHSLAGCEREAAAKLATRGSVAPLGVDRTHAKLPRDLVRKDDPAGRRAGDGLDLERSRPRRDRRPPALRLRRTLKDLELLQIQRRVAPRCEDEVPLTKRARVPEDSLHLGRRDRHHDYSARG